jgi:hypothetical protein
MPFVQKHSETDHFDPQNRLLPVDEEELESTDLISNFNVSDLVGEELPM